jgi:hypothetical protein
MHIFYGIRAVVAVEVGLVHVDGVCNPEPRHLDTTTVIPTNQGYSRDTYMCSPRRQRTGDSRWAAKIHEIGPFPEDLCSRVAPPYSSDRVQMPYVSGRTRRGLKHHVPNSARILSCGKLHEHSRPHSSWIHLPCQHPSPSDSESAQASDRDKPRLLYSETLVLLAVLAKARDCLFLTPISKVSRLKCSDERRLHEN